MIEPLEQFLIELGCRKSRKPNHFILDGFSSEFYLMFDLDEVEDMPELKGTADIYVCPPLGFKEDGLLVVRNCKKQGIMRFMFACGVRQFSDTTKKRLYAMSNPLRGREDETIIKEM